MHIKKTRIGGLAGFFCDCSKGDSHQTIFYCLVAMVGSSCWQHGDHNERNHAWKSSQQMLYSPTQLWMSIHKELIATFVLKQLYHDNSLGLKHQPGEFQGL
jgi:hypothetical protein